MADTPGMKMHPLFALPLLLALVFALVPVSAPAAEPLAQPGFMLHKQAHAGFLGFRSEVWGVEPGVWGVLLLTEAQAAKLNEAWMSTWGRRFDEPGLDKVLAKELELSFAAQRMEILTSDQASMVKQINEAFEELLTEIEGRDGWRALSPEDRSAKLFEKIDPLLSEEQAKNLAANAGQRP